MAELSKRELLEEAKKQAAALERISRWRTISMALSAVGVAVAYMGFTGSGHRLLVGAAGLVLLFAALAFAIVCNLGIRSGRENVERMLNAAEKKQEPKKENREK